VTSTKNTALLTGGSGILGRALIDELAEDFDLVCLRNRRAITDPRVAAQFPGQLDTPMLGLSAKQYSDLARQIDVIVHSAAVTNWKEAPTRIQEINLAGSSAMLRLAEAAQAPLYFISTAFIAHSPDGGENFPGPAAYLRSKVAAEQLVRESSVDSVMVRPSIISGSSVDGRMAAFQGLHRVLGGIVRGHVPFIPCNPNSLIDAVPQDLVASAVGQLLRTQVNRGEYWLTAGANALHASELRDLCLNLSRELELEVEPPRFIAGEAVDRLILPLLEDVLPAKAQETFRDYLELLWMFQVSDPLPTSMADLGFEAQLTRIALQEAQAKSLRYWAKTKGLSPSNADQVA